jgi:hypothetical protein
MIAILAGCDIHLPIADNAFVSSEKCSDLLLPIKTYRNITISYYKKQKKGDTNCIP